MYIYIYIGRHILTTSTVFHMQQSAHLEQKETQDWDVASVSLRTSKIKNPPLRTSILRTSTHRSIHFYGRKNWLNVLCGSPLEEK